MSKRASNLGDRLPPPWAIQPKMSEMFDEEIPNGSEKNKKANKTWKCPVFLLLSIVV